MDDLTGTADERTRQLEAHRAAGPLDREWLERQLRHALAALGEAETALDVDAERRQDF